MGFLSIIDGSLLLSFTKKNQAFPANTGAGIWSGIMVIITSILGITFSLRDSEGPSTKKHLIAFSVFVGLSYACFSLMASWSFQVMGICANSLVIPAWCVNNRMATVAVAAIGGTVAMIAFATLVTLTIIGCVFDRHERRNRSRII
jgi:uncharacterized membrane protein